MSATQIYIASAGSGKTFTLVKEYLKIVFLEAHNGNYNSFRNILAITFTNKATLEMKQRIIHEIKQIAIGEKTDQLKEIQKSYPFIKNFKFLADKILIKLLHDYSNFNIQTIDSFFQNIVKVFAKELDLPLNYEVIIDENEGIDYAVEILMDQIGKDAKITKWLEDYAYSQMDNEKSWDFRSILKSLSKEVFRKESNVLEEELTIQKVSGIKNKLKKSTNSFEVKIEALAKKAKAALAAVDFPDDGINSIFLNSLTKLANGEKGKAFNPSATFRKAINGVGSPIKKTSEKKYPAEIAQLNATSFFDHLSEIHLMLEDELPSYFAYKGVFQNIYALALVGRVTTYLKRYREEQNALFLIDTAKLIYGFITIDDTPFLFEKLANRIQYLFIDEFQDTSTLQWENLRPIIENILSVAEKPLQVLIVGDAKQSIYRFRGGDYELLTHKAAASLPNYNDDPISLNQNWRSLPAIVNFNNSFFESAIQTAQIADDPTLKTDLDLAYKGLHQIGQQTEPEGKVCFRMLSNIEKDWEERALDQMIEDINLLESQGYALNDIAILVKRKSEGVTISQHLQANNKAIVSQETLLLKSDDEVKLVIAALTYLNQPSEALYYTHLICEYAKFKELKYKKNELFMDSSSRKYLNEWCPNFEEQTAGEQHLLSVFERIITLFEINITDNLFVSYLKQVVINFYKNKSTSLSDFLEWWLIEGPKLSVKVEDSKDKISIMTIHKSKGLEFPVVLIPFCSWGFKNKFFENYLWIEDESIEKNVYFPVKAKSEIGLSTYAEHFKKELKLNWIDNLNQLYVAFTRAKDVLIVNCKYENLPKDTINSSSQLIHSVLNQQGYNIDKEHDFIYENGSYQSLPIATNNNKTKENEYEVLPMKSSSFSIKEVEIEQKMSTDEVNIGNLVHVALYYLSTNPAEIAFTKASNETVYSKNVLEEANKHFYNIISSKNRFGQWLADALHTWDEQTIYFEGHELRPDKVIQLQEKYVIIDYKTGGPMTRYHNKMKTYIKAVKSLGIKENVEGYILYTENGELEKVD